MKRLIALSFLLFCCLVPLACQNKPITLPTPSATPTSTATVNTTPTCAHTPMPNSMNLAISANYYVIKTAADWLTINNVGQLPGTNVPLPAVNFSNQMVLEVSEYLDGAGACFIQPVITSVCFYSDHIEVDYQKGSDPCPPNTSGLSGGPGIGNNFQAMVAVPQSNLPVTWIGN